MDSDGRRADGEYFLQRGTYLASARLTLQHYLHCERQGFLIHPDIVSSLQLNDQGTQKLAHPNSDEPLRILDFGTGNGVWALSVASQFTNLSRRVEVTGLDISDGQFPPKQIWPDNLTFGTLSVFDDVPNEYLGKFDLVHIRLLLPAFMARPGRYDLAISNLTKMLKKAGWMQWQEFGTPGFKEVVFDSGSPGGMRLSEHVPPVSRWLQKYLGMWTNNPWIDDLDRFLAEQGELLDVKLLWPESRKYLMRTETELMQCVWDEGQEGLLKISGTEEQRIELLEEYEELREKVSEGSLFTYVVVIGVGRKA